MRAYLLPHGEYFLLSECDMIFKSVLPYSNISCLVQELQRDCKSFVNYRALWKTRDDVLKLAKKLICAGITDNN